MRPACQSLFHHLQCLYARQQKSPLDARHCSPATSVTTSRRDHLSGRRQRLLCFATWLSAHPSGRGRQNSDELQWTVGCTAHPGALGSDADKWCQLTICSVTISSSLLRTLFPLSTCGSLHASLHACHAVDTIMNSAGLFNGWYCFILSVWFSSIYKKSSRYSTWLCTCVCLPIHHMTIASCVPERWDKMGFIMSLLFNVSVKVLKRFH